VKIGGFFFAWGKDRGARIATKSDANHEIYTSNSFQITPGEEIKLNIQLKPKE
jgi:hypothetical protein